MIRERDRCWIQAHIPHHGTMCLLDSVSDWDEDHVECRSATHRAPDNPLRSAGRLAAVCGIEYAAQAMAIHAALLGAPDRISMGGYLASVRNVRLNAAVLDDVGGDLLIRCLRIAGDAHGLLYEFSVTGDGCLLLDGRVGIVMDAARPSGAAPAAPEAAR